MSDAPPPPPNPYAVSATNQQPLSPADERTWAILTHVLALFAGFVSALVIYLLFKDRGPFVRTHVVTEWNFQLTLLIVDAVGFVLAFSTFATIGSTTDGPPSGLALFFIGYALIFVTNILRLIFGIIAAVAASHGTFYRYPIAIRFVKD